MFGLFRVVLASLVALNHFGLHVNNVGPGAPAVMCFYMLSGMLMQRQYSKFQLCGKATAMFLVDRLLRVMPIYWAVLLLFIVTVGGTDLAANIALLPLSYDDFRGVEAIINPAWSLATEFHFYLALPLLAHCSSRTLRACMWASLAIFSFAPFLPHAVWWDYYGLPGVLFVFVAGVLLARREDLRPLFLAVLGLFVIFSIGKLVKAPVPSGINISVCFGVMLAILMIPQLDRLKPKGWDTRLGTLSLPLFLCHPWVISIFGRADIAGSLALSVGTALILTILVERPSDMFRDWVRRQWHTPRVALV